MSFALSNGEIIQTGTDVGLSGLSGITGVTVEDLGELQVYNIGAIRLVINGNLTIANGIVGPGLTRTGGFGEQIKSTGSYMDGGRIRINGTLIVGQYNSNNKMYTNNGGAAAIYQATDDVSSGVGGFGNGSGKTFIHLNTGGTLKCFGREIHTSGGLGASAGSTLELRDSKYSAYRSYWYTNFTIVNTIIQTELFFVAVPTLFSGVDNRNPKSYFAISGTTPNNTYTVKDVPQLPDGDNLLQYGGKSKSVVVNVVNSLRGSDYNYLNQDSSRNYVLNFKREIQAHIVTKGGEDIQGAKFQVRGKSGQVYTQLTDSTGTTSLFEINVAKRETTAGNGVMTYYSKNNDNTDVFDYRIISYDYSLFAPPTENVKGVGVKKFNVALLEDDIVTEKDKSVVEGYTTISTSAQFYDVAKSYLCDNYDGEVTTIVSRLGNVIDAGSYNVVVNQTGAVFAFDGTTITINSSDLTHSTIRTTGTVTDSGSVVGTISDSNGDSDITVIVPTGYDNDIDLYASLTDAKNETNKLASGTNFRYIASVNGGMTLWWRMTQTDGSFIIEDYTLPTDRGSYTVNLVVTGEDQALGQILSIVKEMQPVNTEARDYAKIAGTERISNN